MILCFSIKGQQRGGLYPSGLSFNFLCEDHCPIEARGVARTDQMNLRKKYQINEGDLDQIPGRNKTKRKKKRPAPVREGPSGRSAGSGPKVKELNRDPYDSRICAICLAPMEAAFPSSSLKPALPSSHPLSPLAIAPSPSTASTDIQQQIICIDTQPASREISGAAVGVVDGVSSTPGTGPSTGPGSGSLVLEVPEGNLVIPTAATSANVDSDVNAGNCIIGIRTNGLIAGDHAPGPPSSTALVLPASNAADGLLSTSTANSVTFASTVTDMTPSNTADGLPSGSAANSVTGASTAVTQALEALLGANVGPPPTASFFHRLTCVDCGIHVHLGCHCETGGAAVITSDIMKGCFICYTITY